MDSLRDSATLNDLLGYLDSVESEMTKEIIIPDLTQAEEYWKHIKENIINDHFSEEYWWKAKDRKNFHVRPKAQKSSDLSPTPNGGWAKKFCYWFNNDYVRNIIDERQK